MESQINYKSHCLHFFKSLLSQRLIFLQSLLYTYDWENEYLKDLNSYSNSYVTFNDGATGKIVGNGKLDYPSISSLDDVLLVEFLTINFIYISQLCDQELYESFNYLESIVTNKHLEQNNEGLLDHQTISICVPLKVYQTMQVKA